MSSTSPAASVESVICLDDARAQFLAAVGPWVELDAAQGKRLAGLFEPRTAAPKEPLLRPGKRRYELLFVCRGLLRFYYLSEEGQESNKAFIDAG